ANVQESWSEDWVRIDHVHRQRVITWWMGSDCMGCRAYAKDARLVPIFVVIPVFDNVDMVAFQRYLGKSISAYKCVADSEADVDRHGFSGERIRWRDPWRIDECVRGLRKEGDKDKHSGIDA